MNTCSPQGNGTSSTSHAKVKHALDELIETFSNEDGNANDDGSEKITFPAYSVITSLCGL